MRPIQLPLGIRLDDAATFENFAIGDNAALISLLKTNTEPFIYIWGAAGSGKTHLLQALCHQSSNASKTAMYLPLAGEEALSPEILEGLESTELICIDDVHVIAGNTAWEQALFHFYNRVRDSHHRLYITANVSPNGLTIRLPDLISRLGWGLTYQLHGLRDDQKIAVLQLRARGRGMELPSEVAGYLLKQLPRDMHSLFSILDKLDQVSLHEQRSLTIPFVKQWLKL